jgi:hypothetical protein
MRRRPRNSDSKTNFRVRNCRIFHLKTLDPLALLVVFLLRRYPSQSLNHGGIGMTNKLLNCLAAGALGTALALASPALAFHGGGGMGGGGGGMHAGGMGGGMHAGGMSGGMRFGAMSGGTHFSQGRFASARTGFSPRVSRFAFRDRNRFNHRRFNRFAFVGVPYAYAAYDSCWRRVWTPYGLRWVDVCNGYGY